MSEPRTWEVGDTLTRPIRENLPEGTVLIDSEGDPWKRIDGSWYLPATTFPDIPYPDHGPYTVAWLPEEDA